MKKSFSIGLVLLSMIAFTSCGKTPPASGSNSTNGQATNNGSTLSNTGDGTKTANTAIQPAGEFKAQAGQTSLIQFSTLEVNFEPVITGDTVEAVYPFKNTSQQTVKITQAVTSCNCMQTKFPQGNLHPGQTGQVEVRFLTSGNKGRHEKIIAVVLEGVEESITLRLNGQINEK